MNHLTPLSVAWDALLAKRAGWSGILDRQQKRLIELVAFAREHSRYYAAKYRNLPARIDDARQLPIVTKPDLMAHFDDWVTNPAIKRAAVEAFIADISRIGDSFLHQYLIFTTSGSSGSPAILIQDTPAQAVMTGLTYIRGLSMISAREYWQVFRKGGRQAALFATGGHFLGVTMSRMISVLTPLLCVWCFDVHYLSQNAKLAMASGCPLLSESVDSNCSCFSESLCSWHAKMRQ